MRTRIFIGASVAAVLLSGVVLAQEWPASGGFIVQSQDNICVLHAEYPTAGRADVNLFMVWSDDQFVMQLASSDWSPAPPNDKLGIVFMGIDAAAPRLDVEITPTAPRPGLNGFGFRIREEGLDRFASATSLVVLRGEVVVANLDLTGSSGAVRNLRRCGELVGGRVQADRATIERNAYIPADPFAPAEHYASSTSDPLAIRWARPPRITERDIPQRAIDAGVTGSAVVECQISDMGRPEYCSVISETPEGYGFGAVALRVVARALASPTNAGRKGRATVQFSRID